MGDREELRASLTNLWVRAGKPSSRSLAAAVHRSHTTVNDVLRGHRLPTWEVLTDVVLAMNGNVEDFTEWWIGAQQEHVGAATPTQIRRDTLDELRAIRQLLEERLPPV